MPQQGLEVADGAQVDVRGVVPPVGQRPAGGHAAAGGQRPPEAPVTEVGERHDSHPAHAHHLLQHQRRAMRGLQRLREDHHVVGVVLHIAQPLVDVGHHHRHAPGNAGVEALVGDLHARAIAPLLADEVVEQRAVAAAQVEHPRPARNHGGDDIEVWAKGHGEEATGHGLGQVRHSHVTPSPATGKYRDPHGDQRAGPGYTEWYDSSRRAQGTGGDPQGHP